MEIGTPVYNGQSNTWGVVVKFGPVGPDGDRLVTVRYGTGNLGFHWRSAFMATDLRTVDGLVWTVS